MKPLALITLAALLATPVFAKAPKPIPKNASRVAVSAFNRAINDACRDLTEQKPATTLPQPVLKLGKQWQPKWLVAKDGSAMIVRFMPENDKRLEYGQVDVYITTKPFTTKLKEAPNVMDEGAAIEFEIQRWLPQKWKNYQIPALNNLKLRGYEDMQSGGADNDVHATEPFAIKTQSGKVYWLVVKAESGYHKSLGMTLQKALNALAFE
ncbi:MAG: hypothetical protein H7A51_06765 [Akkermansiaceae bacterium]|nr:hypothetical protein [Akkermansiaceae bacterium]